MSRDDAFVRAALRGEPADVSQLEAYLAAFHDDAADATERSFALLVAGGGIDPYDRLADRLAEAGGPEILDVGCGGGALLERFLARVPEARLSGIDLSGEEIVRARRRLPRSSVRRLDRGNARSLLFRDASFDLVTSHMVLMLLPDPATALAEMRRVLRPGGDAIFLIGRPPAADDPTAGLHAAIHAWIRSLHPRFAPTNPADPRILTRDGTRGLLEAAGFSDVDFDDFAVEADLSPDDVFAMLRRRYYVGSLSTAETAGLRAVLDARLAGRPFRYREHLRIVSARG